MYLYLVVDLDLYIYLRLPMYVFFLLFQKKSFLWGDIDFFGSRAFFDFFAFIMH